MFSRRTGRSLYQLFSNKARLFSTRAALPLVASIDQGTTSTRFIVFDSKAVVVATSQKDIRVFNPHPGWVEEDPIEMLKSVLNCIEDCCQQLKDKNYNPAEAIKSIGITNQRETTILWNKTTGKPFYNAIVWSDSRTSGDVKELISKFGDKNHFEERCGLPLSSYFSAIKIRWLLTHRPDIAEAVKSGNCLFGTVDSWLIWNLCQNHVTDVTNASRTMLMNLRTLEWDDQVCRSLEIPGSILPDIRSSSEVYGHLNQGSLKGVPIAGCLGDQQAALFGQRCLEKGEIKNTYGTGCFLLMNTGQQIVRSSHGLLTTVAYQLSPHEPATYALEGSVATAGSLIKWLRDSLRLFSNVEELEQLARSVEDTGGVYIVPAFSGLLAPYWREDARGTIMGLTHYTNRSHLCLAALEAVAFQSEEVLDAMRKDTGIHFTKLRADGGMTHNSLFLQLQSDISGVPVVKAASHESTALGAAFVGGIATGIFTKKKIQELSMPDSSFHPRTKASAQQLKLSGWRKAVKTVLA